MARGPDEIVAIALLTHRDVRWLGSSLKLIYKTDNEARFDDLLRALDEAEQMPPQRIR